MRNALKNPQGFYGPEFRRLRLEAGGAFGRLVPWWLPAERAPEMGACPLARQWPALPQVEKLRYEEEAGCVRRVSACGYEGRGRETAGGTSSELLNQVEAEHRLLVADAVVVGSTRPRGPPKKSQRKQGRIRKLPVGVQLGQTVSE